MKTKVVFTAFLLTGLLLAATGGISRAQTLNLPPRATNALTGSQFGALIQNITQTSREDWVFDQVLEGNVPNWMRTLVPITVSSGGHTVTYYVIPDYLSIGSDTDYFQAPMSPLLAQRLASLLNCTLPTVRMVNQIWTNSVVRMTANTFNPAAGYTINSPTVFVLENTANRTERSTTTNAHPLGALVSGDKKDIVISTLIYTNFANAPTITKVVVIYGWIQPNGAYIQQPYNGHEETYMDYSHGTRLVQMNVLLDGATNTVTNIVTDAVLNPLLSDEGVIAKPYYTVDNTIGPFIITPPYSQNIKLGGTATLNVKATSDLPIAYQWKLNGANVAGATNTSLVITNAQPTNAGTYTVVLSNLHGLATNIPAILRVTTNAFPLLFNDSLGTDTSTNWNLFFGSAGAPDYTTNWAFDYSGTPYSWNGFAYLIPPSPDNTDGSTRGLKFTVNNSSSNLAGLSIYPKGKSFSNNFALKFNVWINYPGAANGGGATGTTEYATCGINHLGTQPNWANASPSDGLVFAADGEGGSSRDYRDYTGNPAGIPSDLSGAASGLVAVVHTAAPFPTLFPANRFETPGAPGKNWVAGEINQSNGVVTWKLDGTIVAQRSNTSSYTNGNIMLGYMDIFASVANPLVDGFVLFDNVRVEDWSSAPLQAPTVTISPANSTMLTGTNVTFTANATGAAPFTYQWNFNGTNLANATNSSYSLTAVQTTNAGNYGVVVSNVAGSVISATSLAVNVRPFQFNPATKLTNGSLHLSFTGAVGSHYTIQTSSNLVNWLPLITLTNLANPVTYTDTNTIASQRFYRLVTAP